MLNEGYLKVSNIHSIYYSTYGNKNGMPLLFIHGGPGGCSNFDSNFLNIDTNKFYMILFDQRGCGRSLPSGETKENETQYLVDDIKQLLDYLNVKEALIYGSSWGTTLALLFAIKYTKYVKKLFLKSTFLAEYQDNNWLWNDSKKFFPDLYEKFIEPLITDKSNNIEIAKYVFDKFISSDIEKQKVIVSNIINYESSLSTLAFSEWSFLKPQNLKDEDINYMKIFLYYEANNLFLEDRFIFNNISKIKDLPISFYHGRYDMDCPISGVYKIYKNLNNANITIIPYESHSGVLLKRLIADEINKYIIQ